MSVRGLLVGSVLCGVLALVPAGALADDPPTVSPGSAVAITTAAQLIDRVDTHGLAGTFSYAYWAGTGSAPDAPTVVPGAMSNHLPPPDLTQTAPSVPGAFVYGYADGLIPGATYTAQLTATTSAGTTVGAPFSFTTPLTMPPPPIKGRPPDTPPTCALPSVVGHTLAGAQTTLQAGCCHKLALHIRIRVSHTRRHHGRRRVVSQTPRASATVKRGATVTLLLR